MHNVEWGCAEILPELVYNSSEVTDELDDSVIENLYESDCESEFEGFVVDTKQNILIKSYAMQ